MGFRGSVICSVRGGVRGGLRAMSTPFNLPVQDKRQQSRAQLELGFSPISVVYVLRRCMHMCVYVQCGLRVSIFSTCIT